MSDKRSERMLEELLKVPGNSKSESILDGDGLLLAVGPSLLREPRDLPPSHSQLADK
jgi:hypothetical protein